MFRIAFFVTQLLVLILIISHIFSNPFVVSFDIENLKYTFSSNFFIGLIILFIFLIIFVFYIFFRSRISFSKFLLKNKYKKIEKGYNYFVDGMIALANKDNKTAIIAHRKMNNFLKDDPSLSLLLQSEVYKIEKKYSELKNIYERMLKSKKTETLGYRGLMEQNLNNQDYHHAFIYGEKLFYLNPKIEKIYETLVYIVAKTRNWNQLISITDKAYTYNLITKDKSNENKSIALFEIAKVKLNSDLKETIKIITKALDLNKNFPPFIKLQLEAISKTKNISNLKKLIKNYWYKNPNSLLRYVLLDIIIENNLDNLDFIKQLVKNNFNDEESKKLFIFFAIRNKEWKLARDNIIGIVGSNPSKEICNFMAEIELGEKGDKQKSDAWLLRSQNASVENLWICKITNQSQLDWDSVSISGHFNSLVWTKPKMLNLLYN